MPLGDIILVNIEPFAVEDRIPEEEYIDWAVKCLRNNRAGGPSQMRAEDLKGWLAVERRGEKEREAAVKDGGSWKDAREGAENWARVVDLIQTAFLEGGWRRKPYGRR